MPYLLLESLRVHLDLLHLLATFELGLLECVGRSVLQLRGTDAVCASGRQQVDTRQNRKVENDIFTHFVVDAKQKIANVCQQSLLESGEKFQMIFANIALLMVANARTHPNDTCLDFGLQCLLPLGLAHAVFALLSDLSAQIRERGLQAFLRRLQGGGLRRGAKDDAADERK
jgi:hypothetical protein